MRVLFFGSDNVALTTLQALRREAGAGRISALSVVVPEAKPAGRGQKTLRQVPVERWATKEGLPLHTVGPSMAGWELPGEFDVGVVVSFGRFIPASVSRAFTLGTLNMHPSLLPRWRGPAPIEHALMAGDSVTGVSVQTLDEHEFDAGSILAQVTVVRAPIYPDDTYSTLSTRLAHVGAEAVVGVVSDYATASANAYAQPTEGITHAPKVTDYTVTNWASVSPTAVHNAWRGVGESVGVSGRVGLARGKTVRAKYVELARCDDHTRPETLMHEQDERIAAVWQRKGKGQPEPRRCALHSDTTTTTTTTTTVTTTNLTRKSCYAGRVIGDKANNTVWIRCGPCTHCAHSNARESETMSVNVHTSTCVSERECGGNIRTCDSGWIGATRLHVAGRKESDARTFDNGYVRARVKAGEPVYFC